MSYSQKGFRASVKQRNKGSTNTPLLTLLLRTTVKTEREVFGTENNDHDMEVIVVTNR